ncbi:MAG: hypothetical protein IH870_10605 [Chloroflexi bacterium]|nr:hypothetical protein [Chloroflexota bacterium]
MLKADRDKIMNRLSPEDRSNFRRILQELRKERKTSPGQRVTAREVLQTLGEDLPEQQRAALEAVMTRDETGPKVGEVPPDFSLKLLGSPDRVSLSSFKDRQPVALVFGSYT